MKYRTIKYWKCLDCDVIFKSTDDHHCLDYCPNFPKCQNGIDHEQEYIRIISNIKGVEELK